MNISALARAFTSVYPGNIHALGKPYLILIDLCKYELSTCLHMPLKSETKIKELSLLKTDS